MTGAPAQAEPTALEHPQQARAELDRAMARADAELEPQPDLIMAARGAKATKRQTLADALRGRPSRTSEPSGTVGLDGGARRTPERVETHAGFLSRVLPDRSADVGVRF